MTESLGRPIPRTLDNPPRILGLSPIELAASALAYAILSPLLQGIPFSPLISLTLSLCMGLGILILNRTYPPAHGIHALLWLTRPRVFLAMEYGLTGKDRYERNR